MKYVPIEMTERIQRIKDAYRELPVPSMKDPYHPEHYRPYGSGDRMIEGAFLAAHARHPAKVGVRLGYDEPMSHRVQAGADAIVGDFTDLPALLAWLD